MGGIGRATSLTPTELDAAGNKMVSQLAAATRNWAQTQANLLVSSGQFGPQQQRDLEMQASSKFPGTDKATLVGAIRYLALKASAGGQLTKFGTSAPSAFQSQLLSGVTLRG